MALWQIVFDPDLLRRDPPSSTIFSWMLCKECEAGVSSMEALEAVNHALLSGISFNLMVVTYGEKIRKCGKDLWTFILSPQPQKETEMNGMAIWSPILLQQIKIQQFIPIQSPSTVGIIYKNTSIYEMLSSFSMKTELQDTENGSSHFSPSQTHKKAIYGSSCRPRRATPWMDYCPVFIANGFYKNKTDFCNQHVIWSRFAKFPKIDRYFNTRRLERLRDRILVEMDFKRSTIQHHEDVWCNYSHLKYKTFIRERFNLWTNEPVKNAAELCFGIRRIVNEDTDRQVKLMEIFEDHQKLIIFYNYDYEREILLNLFENVDGCEIGEWNGHAHNEVPDGPEWVYLVQYNAGAEGWNCITTDTIVFFSQTYSYKQLQQACGRIDRLNTRFVDLYYFHLKSRSGIDAAISRALSNKKKFNEGAYMRKMQIQFDNKEN